MSPELDLVSIKLAVIIPTRNRPDGIRNLLNNLQSQTKKPDLIILVDSSDLKLDLADFSDELVIRHLDSKLRSAAHQRNVGLKLIYSEFGYFNLVCFLDDDLEIPTNYLEYLSTKLIASKAIGISGVAEVDRFLESRKLHRYFSYHVSGRLTTGGLNFGPAPNIGIQKSDWLIGCSLWLISSLQLSGHFFEGDFLGQSIFEDAIFSHHLSHFGEICVDTDFIFSHKFESSERPSSFLNSSDWMLNRFRLITTDTCLTRFRFVVDSLIILILAMFRRVVGSPGGHDVKGILDGFRRIARAL